MIRLFRHKRRPNPSWVRDALALAEEMQDHAKKGHDLVVRFRKILHRAGMIEEFKR